MLKGVHAGGGDFCHSGVAHPYRSALSLSRTTQGHTCKDVQKSVSCKCGCLNRMLMLLYSCTVAWYSCMAPRVPPKMSLLHHTTAHATTQCESCKASEVMILFGRRYTCTWPSAMPALRRYGLVGALFLRFQGLKAAVCPVVRKTERQRLKK